MKMCYYLHFKVSLNTILNGFFRAVTYKCDRMTLNCLFCQNISNNYVEITYFSIISNINIFTCDINAILALGVMT